MREIKRRINVLLDEQEAKGIETYGQSLEDCPENDYDWNRMTMEELIDALQYQVKENIRLQNSIKIIKTKKGVPTVIHVDGKRFVYDPNTKDVKA
ncbi:hypothetical protein MUO14_23995 [Halobacillus shinanisalinarum]|uniref:Uncharacterized protein n=1 Tax=Halobacillus shinanisalinarum TaxID=2932258 RepID=A0ABY4GZ68_9BACI|nr:hypothetical protein [Halobacillus shinanisalinarum]UOQ93394.1 hypothetical protein MUO14_23995 [Halobacillus shinanisalinarum]